MAEEWNVEHELAVTRLASKLGYRPRTVKTLLRLGILAKSMLDLDQDLS